jgi:Pvc16 N-terminal domain
MLRLLDIMIRDLLVAELPALVTDQQVRFQPPDAQLRTDVANLAAVALDIYLVDLRENRKLRSNERVRSTNGDGFVTTERLPDRVDCHYLISAWSPAQLALPIVDPTLDEHALLYETAAVLMRAGALNPSRVYLPGAPALAAWPARFRDIDLGSTVLPPEGFGRLSEFWTTMGQDMRWKPCLYLIVTLPVALVQEVAGPMVTTTFTDLRVTATAATSELWLGIGGQVIDARTDPGNPVPVPNAWVRLETLAGTPVGLAQASETGRFTFERLRASQYRIRGVATGLAEQTRTVDVPSETGEYDLRFT